MVPVLVGRPLSLENSTSPKPESPTDGDAVTTSSYAVLRVAKLEPLNSVAWPVWISTPHCVSSLAPREYVSARRSRDTTFCVAKSRLLRLLNEAYTGSESAVSTPRIAIDSISSMSVKPSELLKRLLLCCMA